MACTDPEVGCLCVLDALDCDNDPTNGCDLLDTAEHCGTCDPGFGCEVFGVAQVCTVDVPGERGRCEAVCADGLVDFDGDLATTPTNGCESGLRELATSPLTGLEGKVVRTLLERDSNRLRVLTLDSAWLLRLYQLYLQNEQVTVVSSTEVGTLTTMANTIHVAASGNIIAVVWDRENMLFLRDEGDGTFTELLRAQEPFVLDVVERWYSDPYEAIFVVAARNTTNVHRLVYVIFEPSPGPANMECNPVGGGLDFCVAHEQTLPYPITALFGREVAEPWVLAGGQDLHLFELTPGFTLLEVTPPAGFDMLRTMLNAQAIPDALLTSSGDRVFAFARTGFPSQGGGTPTLTQTAEVPLRHPSTTMAVLDSLRTIVLNEVGLEFVLTAGAASTTVDLPVDAPFDALMVAFDYKVIAFRGAEATVYEMILGALNLP